MSDDTMNYVKMKAQDTISGKMAKCTIEIDNKRYNFMNAINFEASFKKKKSVVNILGKSGSGNRSTGWEGTGKMTVYYNTSIMRELFEKFKDKGTDTYFEIVVENCDDTSGAKHQKVTFTGCNLDEGILAKFDASSDDPLDEEVSFTFEGFKIDKKFNDIDGMKLTK